MKSSADVVYRDFDSSPALTSIIEKRLEKLGRFSDSIMSTRVVLESPHNHKHKGKMFRACIEMAVKGSPVTVTHDDPSVHVAVRDAFQAAERKIKEVEERRRVSH
ncbi:MAG TPA: HPF/RaiA family ribosome-associated protein [Cellvibrionaceae bacterium]|jgi:ribosomal subunit interface protein|nr:HPF/RaiA family ribosome-associated protein [Cellvibrionaceae bacterium]HMW70986.1 HPF/RaiA family ribosome-associated protein [Cellvibrionaceae bacterium]HMY37786.1 HPF/RaiA family ribosome-associated protein [Marinagarivorans sp.]HNG58419.1 HPF/RaiA family ribosome-associated protein [Cellvibrionaceae bacterium]HRH75966.1 HPF/RaiA family ribosome-associated protein [Cellvibrionaceae bacterium]